MKIGHEFIVDFLPDHGQHHRLFAVPVVAVEKFVLKAEPKIELAVFLGHDSSALAPSRVTAHREIPVSAFVLVAVSASLVALRCLTGRYGVVARLEPAHKAHRLTQLIFVQR